MSSFFLAGGTGPNSSDEEGMESPRSLSPMECPVWPLDADVSLMMSASSGSAASQLSFQPPARDLPSSEPAARLSPSGAGCPMPEKKVLLEVASTMSDQDVLEQELPDADCDLPVYGPEPPVTPARATLAPAMPEETAAAAKETPPKPGKTQQKDGNSNGRGGDKKARCKRGEAGTFAGRRPPKNEEKLKVFNQLKEEFNKAKKDCKDQLKVKSKSGGDSTANQQEFWTFVQKHMKEQKAGTTQNRLSAAAAAWRAQKLAGEKGDAKKKAC